MNPIKILAGLISSMAIVACTDTSTSYDATGAFEADEIIISAEASGTLLIFTLEEGQLLKEGTMLGYIDTTQLYLQKKQLRAQMSAIRSKKPDINIQLIALKEQLKAAEKEKARVMNLIKADAATPKQLDDVNAQIEIIKGNISATNSTLNKTKESLDKEVRPLLVQEEVVNDMIRRSILKAPLSGTALAVYREQFEQVGKGMPLYKIADLSTMTLKAYITGDQLTKVKLNQKVKVMTDDGQGSMYEEEGTVYWISDKAEFTPKSVQTKDERANKVYAIKVRVKNDGRYKIGMYGEVKL